MTQFIIFISLALVILFGAHYLLYFSVIKFFSIVNSFYKNILLAVLSFLAVSFVLSSILARIQENILTRAFYFVSGYWLGLLLNFIMAVAVIWLIVGIAGFSGMNINRTFLAAIFFVLAIIYSFYGVWNALNPRIKNIFISIPNLPEQWKGKKIVQISDLHLGYVHGENFIRKVVDKINLINPEAVVITGDLFDGMDGNLDYLAVSIKKIYAKKGIFFVTGNHETYLGIDKVFAALEKIDVKILQDEVVDVDGLKIIGLSYPNAGEKKDEAGILKSLKKDFVGQPNILLYHAPFDIDKIKESGVNLQLSGHTHKGQIFPFGYITKLVYKGYDYGLFEMGDYTLYTTSGTGTWGPTMRTGSTPEIVVITLQ